MKNIKRNSIIILILTLLILGYILKDNYNEIITTLANANIFYILLAILVYLLYFIFDKFSLYNLIRQYNKDISFKYVIYLGTITKFFDGITPLASGGQPLQVYEMHKKGVSISNGTNIVIQNYIVFQIAFVFLGIVAYILNHAFNLFAYVPVLKQLTFIGFTINGVILILLFMVIFSKNFNKSIVRFFIKIISIFNKKINKEKMIKKWDKICYDYYLNGQVLLNNKKKFLKCIFYQIISSICFYLVTLPIAYAMGINTISLVACLAAGSYIYMMGCYVPIPGATGGMEFGFYGFFGNFVSGTELPSLMIVWRFITYYLPTIIGAIVFNIGPGKEVKGKDIKNLIKEDEK